MSNIHLHPIMHGILAPIVPPSPTQREIATRQLRQEQEAALALYDQIKRAPIGTWVALESLDKQVLEYAADVLFRRAIELGERMRKLKESS